MRKESIQGLGTITFIKRKNNKRINVKIEPHSNIKVSLPQHIPYHTAKKFVVENWLLIQNKMKSINGRLTLFEPTTEFKTMWHVLKVEPTESTFPYFNIGNHFISVKYPQHTSVLKPEIQKTIRAANAGRTIVIHCHAGLGRSGMFAACLAKVVFDMDAEEASQWVRQYIPNAVETWEQHDFIKNFEYKID